MPFLARWLITALSIGLASRWIQGFHTDGYLTLGLASLLLGLVNGILRPILVFFTLPLTVVTLGLFLIVLNAAMLGLTAWMLPGFSIDGFVPAVLGWAVITVVGWLSSLLIGSWRTGPAGK
jgi:putative membrane protein